MDQNNLTYPRKINEICLSTEIDDWTNINLDSLLPKSKNIKKIDQNTFAMLSKKDFKKIYLSHHFLCSKLEAYFTEKLLSNIIFTKISTYFSNLEQMKNLLKQDSYLEYSITFQNNYQFSLFTSTQLTSKFLNRLSGGGGDVENQDSFTDLEVDILESLYQELPHIISKHWDQPIKASKLAHKKFDEDLYFSKYSDFVCIELQTSINKTQALPVYLIYSVPLIKDLIKTELSFKPNTNKNQTIKPLVKNNIIESKVVVGSTKVLLKDVLTLAKGDILICDQAITAPLSLQINTGASIPVSLSNKDDKLVLSTASHLAEDSKNFGEINPEISQPVANFNSEYGNADQLDGYSSETEPIENYDFESNPVTNLPSEEDIDSLEDRLDETMFTEDEESLSEAPTESLEEDRTANDSLNSDTVIEEKTETDPNEKIDPLLLESEEIESSSDFEETNNTNEDVEENETINDDLEISSDIEADLDLDSDLEIDYDLDIESDDLEISENIDLDPSEAADKLDT